MLPILSLGSITEGNNRVMLESDGGDIVREDTGETDTMIRCVGVYVIKMLLPDHVVNPDFTRPGPM